MRLTLPLMALTLLLVACGEVEVSLSTDATAYQPRDTVRLELRNEGTREVGYNLCLVRLERREDTGWSHTPHLGENVACLAIEYPLKAGARAHGSLTLPSELAAGEYRIVHDVNTRETDAQGRTVEEAVISNSFLIEQ
ncbi:immunoglobulin-like domain-containing protein [Corallococcus sp. CA049B]|uniref:immunoglobulin-like domain-containing protein n=1 Tax=Corallococcus sp. CA049B TaxID=2316730 RepID=UPI0011C36A56|nr:immunoglobulin-like domain-containing protein [Corallococcus sp. CA049B]